jgi:hypothetical protein
VTVTTQVSFKLAVLVVTVIVAVPIDQPVTRPSDETVATPLLLLSHETLLSVASAGETVAVSLLVPPSMRVSVLLLIVTPVTVADPSTVTVHVAVLDVSAQHVAVMVAVPALLPITQPPLTIATSVSLLVQVTR